MKNIKSFVALLTLVSLVGVIVIGCSPGRRNTRQDVRQETRVEDRTEDRMDRRR